MFALGVKESYAAAAWLSGRRHSSKGLRPRACQVSNRLASTMRVLVPSGLREPPLILRITTSGRILRSAWLLSALKPATSTNWVRADATSGAERRKCPATMTVVPPNQPVQACSGAFVGPIGNRVHLMCAAQVGQHRHGQQN